MVKKKNEVLGYKTKYIIVKYTPSDRYGETVSEFEFVMMDDLKNFILYNYSVILQMDEAGDINGSYGYSDAEYKFIVDGEVIASTNHPEFQKLVKLAKEREAEVKKIEEENRQRINAQVERQRREAKRMQEAAEMAIYEKIKAKLEKRG